MLTDLRSLTLDVQEIPAVTDSGAESFAGMFHQRFPEVAADGKQVAEFKEFFENIPLQADTSAITLEVSPITPRSELPAPIPGAADTPAVVSLDHLDSLLSGPLQPVAEPLPEMEAGELLPVGGNQLPPERPVGKVDPGVVESAVQTPMTIAVTPPVIKPVDVAALQSQPTAETRTPSAAVQPGANILPQLNTVMPPAGPDPVILKQKVASAESVPAVAGAVSLELKPATDRELPAQAGATRNPATTAELALSRSEVTPGSTQQSAAVPVTAGSEFRPEEAPDIASRVLNNTTGRAVQVSSPGVEASADRTILYRDNGPTGEPVAMREIIGNIDNRAAELPAQNAANASQQPGSNVTASAAAASVSAATSVTPSNQQNPLPPQLESMNLTRNADANEWSNGLSERINWMINQKQNTATIRLDPPALGKLDVQIKIVDEATMITIQAQTAQTRDLIDSASIRLRDFLQESGYQNVNVDVSQRQDQQQARSQAPANGNPDQDENSGQEQAAEHQQQQDSYFSGEGLVDTFA
jgi:flagellar hook-length control protein FliK